MNGKKLYRLYKEERLTVCKRSGRKRALGTRAPMTILQGKNKRWSLDFVFDALVGGRRFRILCVVECSPKIPQDLVKVAMRYNHRILRVQRHQRMGVKLRSNPAPATIAPAMQSLVDCIGL